MTVQAIQKGVMVLLLAIAAVGLGKVGAEGPSLTAAAAEDVAPEQQVVAGNHARPAPSASSASPTTHRHHPGKTAPAPTGTGQADGSKSPPSAAGSAGGAFFLPDEDGKAYRDPDSGAGYTDPDSSPGKYTDPDSPFPESSSEIKDDKQTAVPASNPFLGPWWQRVPPVQKMPPSGLYIFMPDTPGYYSLKDLLFGPYRPKPPPHPHPRFGIIANSFFDQDFRYVDSTGGNIFERLKRIHIDDLFLLSVGGEFRGRYNNEVDSRLSGRNNAYELTRTRVFADLWYRDRVRTYIEFIDAQTFNQDLSPLLVDHNHGDLLNFFSDIYLFDYRERPVYFRAGRQELLYGSQRLISPLDWVNTRRTFQGVKAFWQNDKWSVDLFCVQPVIVSPNTFDPGNNHEVFSGLWVSYRPGKGRYLDLYYLNLNSSAHFVDPSTGIATFNPGLFNLQGNFQPSYNTSTLGSRWFGNTGTWMWDLEGMFQFGPYDHQQTLAKAFTTGGGYRFKDILTQPQIWLYYDYASGDPNPGSGNVQHTFNQLFPFGHPYFGFIDVVGRQNINDFNGQIAFHPTRWITTLVQYHVFRLDSARDALYNASGTPLRRDPTGAAGNNVGDELDFLINIRITQEQNVLLSYSHLYAGDFLRRTGSPFSPDYLYLQYTFRF